jgi:hypothetical protein
MFQHDAYWALVGGAAPVIVLVTMLTTSRALERVLRTALLGDHRTSFTRFSEFITAAAQAYMTLTAYVLLGIGAAVFLLDLFTFVVAAVSLSEEEDVLSTTYTTVTVCLSLFLVFVQLGVDAYFSMWLKIPGADESSAPRPDHSES